MKTIYDDIIEHDFKIDSEGNMVFFAKGLKKPGFIIPNEEKKKEIKKIITQYSTALMSLILIWFFILKHSIIIFVIFLALLCLLHFGWYRRKIDRAIIGLPTSDLTPKYDLVDMRIVIGLLVVVLIFIFGWLFLFGMAKSGGLKGIIISLSLFAVFFVAAMIGIYFFIIKKKQGKDI
jgi:hypothetical protein